MDISMPMLDGIEATRRIREQLPDACVLVLTGSSISADVDRARQAGVAAFLTKDRLGTQLVDAILEVGRALELATLCRCSTASASRQFVFFHFMTSLALITLVLMHSGRDTGMAGMGYVPAVAGRDAHRRAEPDAADGRRRHDLLRQHDRPLPPPGVTTGPGRTRSR